MLYGSALLVNKIVQPTKDLGCYLENMLNVGTWQSSRIRTAELLLWELIDTERILLAFGIALASYSLNE